MWGCLESIETNDGITHLMMSTELTFSRISWLYGLAHGIVTQEQYSFLVVAVIASAVAHTVIAGGMFVPLHLEGFQGIRLSVVPNRFVCYDGRERTEMEFSRRISNSPPRTRCRQSCRRTCFPR
ncbi:hypothetical protein NSPZN2_150046 [Nitrospira defluvii]|uniref:Uncharacterized protein n=1 Tax=Nitrospira defluvii TaxID=330214 RepID=A0ABM8RAN7_9BACT|nr:hypothetical protein NSPZN2_150046 [Nitrospira defluvii]